VDLNLIRAAMAETLETSDHTSVQRWIETLIQDSNESAAGETSETEDTDERVSPSVSMKPDRFLSPLSSNRSRKRRKVDELQPSS